MFELLNTFWGGAISLAGGLLVIFSLFKAVTARPRLIAYDFRSERVVAPKLPNEYSISYNFQGKEFASIHKTEVILKNETQSPLTDASFIEIPSLKTGSSIICSVRKVEGIDDSRFQAKIANDGTIQLTDLMIPIDSSATVEIVSVTPIDQTLVCVHKDAKTIRRNYGWAPRSKAFLLAGPFMSMPPAALLLVIATYFFGHETISAYAKFVKSGWEALFIPEPVASVLTLFHIPIAIFFVCLIYRLQLHPTDAEDRFTDAKL